MIKLNNFKGIALIIFFAIPLTLLLPYIAFVLLIGEFPSSMNEIWNHWDTQHYIDIARNGYPGTGDKTYLIAFFPLYPLLIKIFSFFFSGNLILSALVVSNVAYAIAAIYLYKIVLLDYSEKIALRTVFYFSVFPTAYFLHAGYTESLFIALTVSSFYYGRKGKWFLAGFIGMFSAATRITGIVLPVALLIEYIKQKEFSVKNTNNKEIVKIFISSLLISSGFALYLGVNFMTFGNPLQFLEIQQENWYKSLSSPLTGFKIALNTLLNAELYSRLMVGLSELVFGIGTMGLTFWSFFNLRISYSVYMLIMCFLITSTSFWLSIPRYTLTMFPLFIGLALLAENRLVKYMITFISVILFSVFFMLFTQGKWAF